MVETISPMVHGGRNSRYWLVWFLHALGAALAATATGFLLGALGAVLGAPWGALGTIVLLAVAAAYSLRDLLGLPIPLPDLKREVPEWWRTFFSPPVTSTLYGLGLGAAFYTSLRFGTYVVVAAAVVAMGDPVLGALVCAPFGLGRAIVVAVADRGADGGEPRFLSLANGAASLVIGISFFLLWA